MSEVKKDAVPENAAPSDKPEKVVLSGMEGGVMITSTKTPTKVVGTAGAVVDKADAEIKKSVTAPSPSKKSAAKKAATKKAATKKAAAKKPVKKAATKKPVKKASAKKAVAKKPVKKSVAKTPTKKPAAKPAKKAAPVKKAVTKKPAAPKVAKKPADKKKTAKKAAMTRDAKLSALFEGRKYEVVKPVAVDWENAFITPLGNKGRNGFIVKQVAGPKVEFEFPESSTFKFLPDGNVTFIIGLQLREHVHLKFDAVDLEGDKFRMLVTRKKRKPAAKGKKAVAKKAVAKKATKKPAPKKG